MLNIEFSSKKIREKYFKTSTQNFIQYVQFVLL